MAKSGYVIGFSADTATNPTQYWGGTELVNNIDDAQFVPSLNTARVQAGNLQAEYPENHVEAYSATLTVAHTPALGSSGI